MAHAPAIGIDLGTTYSSVGVCQNGRVDIIANDQGNRLTPSIVAFTSTKCLIGEDAKIQTIMSPGNTIVDIKRLIGRKFGDTSVQGDRKLWPVEIVNDGGRPKVVAQYKEKKTAFFPEEITAMVLTQMKETAESYLGQKVTDAVISVPAKFNYSQRQATINAGKIAGLNILRIINETTAAAIAFQNQNKTNTQTNILVFDVGGGTCDVSVLSIDEGLLKVKSTAGNTNLGGEDFDHRLITHFVQEFKRKFNKDLTRNKLATFRLKAACERAKRTLSSSSQAYISIDSLYDGIDFKASITRARFEEIIYDLITGMRDCIVKALRDAKINPSQIHEIILVGGSTRIPLIQKMLKGAFNGKTLNKSIDPDEAVVYGAAIQAAMLQHDQSEKVQRYGIVDINPCSLGFEAASGVMSLLFKRNTPLPSIRTQLFTTSSADQSAVGIKVFEGESAQIKDNDMLELLTLANIPRGQRIPPELAVTFEINANGILIVSAIEKSTGNDIRIIRRNFGLDEEEVHMLKKKIEQIKGNENRFAALSHLQLYCFKMQKLVKKEMKLTMTGAVVNAIMSKCDAVIRWVDDNNLAAVEETRAIGSALQIVIADIKANPSKYLPVVPNFVNVCKTAERMLQCPIEGCSYQNEKYIEVQHHAKEKHEERVVPCNLCECKMFLESKISLHHGNEHSCDKTCPFCYEEFKNYSCMQNHMYVHHREYLGMVESVDCTRQQPVFEKPLVERMGDFCLNFALPDTRVLDYGKFLINYDTKNFRPLFACECLTGADLNAEHFEKSVASLPFEEDARLTSQQMTQESIAWLMMYECGHLAAAGNYRYSEEAWEITFVMPNISPMLKHLNHCLWRTLEEHVRRVGKTCSHMYVFTIPIYGKNKPVASAGGVMVHIPIAFSKVIYIEKPEMETTCQIFIIENGTRQSRTSIFKYTGKFASVFDRTGFIFKEVNFTLEIGKRLKVFKCIKGACSRTFNTEERLANHQLTHQNKCHVCQKEFATEETMRSHMEVHRIHQCTFEGCSKTFVKKELWKYHIAQHEGVKLKDYSCTICHKTFGYRIEWNKHMRMHAKETIHKCQVCLEEFKTEESLKIHWEYKHSEDTCRKCNKCTRFFPTEEEFDEHSKVCPYLRCLPFKCDKCAMSFRRKDTLKEHMKTHSDDERPYKCDECPKSYNEKYSLKFHKSVAHSDEKNYKCEKCEYATNSKACLKSHKLVHTDDKPYACPKCPKAFKNEGKLKRHMKSRHSEDRPFSCKECSSTFKRKDMLTEHNIRIHTSQDEWQFKCVECGKKYPVNSDLKKHMKRAKHAKSKCNETPSATPNISDQAPEVGIPTANVEDDSRRKRKNKTETTQLEPKRKKQK